jgi:hypothetical protein
MPGARFTKLVLLAGALAGWSLPTVAFAALSCSVTTVCNSPNVVVFRLADPAGDHAELSSQSLYPNLVCCGNVSGLSTTCGGTHQVVIRLFDVTNSHVEQNNQGNYSNDACLSVASGGSVSVGYQTGNCAGFDTTVASLSDVTNAHVGDGNAYPLKVCASASASVSNGGGSGGGVGGGTGNIMPLYPTSSASGTIDQALNDRLAALPVPVNSLVKIATDSAVYLVGSDGFRHAYPNEKTYFSWYCAFDGIITISSSDLSKIPLGKNIVYRPGSRLVKFQSVPTVYSVEQNGTLRALPSEAFALNNFGPTWMKQVDDISDAFYTDYRIGSPWQMQDTLLLSPLSCQNPPQTIPSSFRFTTTLGPGSTDTAAIRYLQILLRDLGPSIYPEGKITGTYGSLTVAAVKRFQDIHNLSPLGILGPSTRALLNAILDARH